MARGLYILIGQTPIPEPDTLKWAVFMDDFENNCRVGSDFIDNNNYRVSTIFLGIDFSAYLLNHEPQLFETMIFGLNDIHMYQERCSTWLEAEAQHKKAIEWLEKEIKEKTK
jgi:hypothetical protein